MNKLLITNGFYIFGIHIAFYGILIALGFILAFLVTTKLAKIKGYNADLPYNLLFVVFPLAIVGARLYYVLFSGTTWTFLEILEIWHGGLAIYGGIIASVIGLLVYAIVKKINFFQLLDLVAPGLILGQAIGRWGNFFNQEAYGIAIQNPALQWFPAGVFIESDGLWHYATFFYESIWCLLGFVLLIIVFKKTNKVALTTSIYLAWYGFERFFVEGLRTDSLYFFNTGLRVSQVLSAILFLVGFVGIIVTLFVSKKGAKPIKWKKIKKY